jgi:hypothetical protein
MKTSFLSIALLALSLIAISCNGNKKSTSKAYKKEVTTKSDSNAAISSAHQQNIITQNEGKYPRDIQIFKDTTITNRLKKVAGNQYNDIVKNFETQTPIVSVNGIYKFSGCKQHACPAFQTIVLYDSHHDNFNILVIQKGDTTEHNEKGKINIPKGLKHK